MNICGKITKSREAVIQLLRCVFFPLADWQRQSRRTKCRLHRCFPCASSLRRKSWAAGRLPDGDVVNGGSPRLTAMKINSQRNKGSVPDSSLCEVSPVIRWERTGLRQRRHGRSCGAGRTLVPSALTEGRPSGCFYTRLLHFGHRLEWKCFLLWFCMIKGEAVE